MEENMKTNACIYINLKTLMYSRNEHIINQLHFNKNKFKKKKIHMVQKSNLHPKVFQEKNTPILTCPISPYCLSTPF